MEYSQIGPKENNMSDGRAQKTYDTSMQKNAIGILWEEIKR